MGKMENSNTSFWAQTPETARVLLKTFASNNRLVPDYSLLMVLHLILHGTDYDAKRYQYDAMRCALNVGMDYHWFRSDTTNQEQMTNLLYFSKVKL